MMVVLSANVVQFFEFRCLDHFYIQMLRCYLQMNEF